MVVPFNLTQVEFDGYTDDGNMFLFMVRLGWYTTAEKDL